MTKTDQQLHAGAARRSDVTDDGAIIAYLDSGPREAPAVALCHGICAGGRQFEADAGYFATRGYRVIVPDLRGHGASDIAGYRAEGFTIPRLAADMLSVLDDAGIDRIHWLGNSLGGIAGLSMLASAPQRFRSFATFGTAYRLGLPAAAPPLLPLLYRVAGPQLLGGITAAMTTDVPAARTMIAEMIAAFDPRVGRLIAESVRQYDFIAEAQRYDGPILLVRGGRDRAVNLALGHTLTAMAGRPNFTRIDLAKAGHCANLDLPNDLRPILETFWGPAAS